MYPYGTPGTGVYDIYVGTVFTPLNNVALIRDNYTSIDKASLVNTLGVQLARVQNFVNSTYLGRPNTPVQTMYGGELRCSGTSYSNPQYIIVNQSGITMSGLTTLGTENYFNEVTANYLRMRTTNVITGNISYNYMSSTYTTFNTSSNGNSLTLASNYIQLSKSTSGYLWFGRNLTDTSLEESSGSIYIAANQGIRLLSDVYLSGNLSGCTGFNLNSDIDASLLYSGQSLMVSGRYANFKHSQFVNIMSFDGGLGSSVNIWCSGNSSQINLSSRGDASHVDIYATGISSYITMSTDTVGSDINILSNGDLNLWIQSGGSGLISIKNSSSNGQIETISSGNMTLIAGASGASKFLYAYGQYVQISGYTSAAINATSAVALGSQTSINFNCDAGRYYFEAMPISAGDSGTIWNSGGYLCIAS